ncbi:heptosyltransferase [Alcaligenaceae bacterium]|nr:heptosyltransferase [Alcaligenaceae bacterium]
MSTPSAIYVRLPNWIGDVCMSLPSLHALLDTGLPIIVCARAWAKDLLAAYPLAGFLEMTGHWRQDRATVHGHRRKHYPRGSRGLLLPDSLSSAMVFKFAGVASAGYRDDGRSLILRWPINKPRKDLHAVQSWYTLTTQALQRWNLATTLTDLDKELGLELTGQHRTDAAQALSKAGVSAGQFILIAPTATGLHKGKIKVWPHFDALTRQLQDLGHSVVMCPPPSEVDAARQNAPTALLLPPLKLGAFATLTQLAALVVCNDSGVSHVAAAAGAKQLTLFGVTEQERTGPWSSQAHCLGSASAWPSQEQTIQKVLALLG